MSERPSPFDPAAAAQKIIELEEKLMFQQQSTDELQGVVLAQSTELAQLRSELESFRAMFEDLLGGRSEGGVGDDLPHEKPPHY